ncbi:MAG: hypothetical protein DWQ18_01730 [Crenarchaeota archaeon]|nr:MAG: hypothetical protein DWQ17_06800 [Thermoproteota archaeon]RDJ33675.1 MAG: hypothetical protein DWQ18_01730 [Thermoproteota archaeon]RDJ37253.1 MAG: hypothetical protein DWQ19_01940 [Thermoproteota archaeon]RDJ39207.1 MAG: hypothetical protein DWQ13_02830 [Thermoproteota archaeon]
MKYFVMVLLLIGFILPIFAQDNAPPPAECKSGPKPDGEGWVFVDCKWKQYADVPVENCMKGKAPANNYAWNAQDCVWEWSPLRNENASGPIEEIPTDSEQREPLAKGETLGDSLGWWTLAGSIVIVGLFVIILARRKK